MAYMSSGYGVPLAAQDYTWCWGSNMEPRWTSCRFTVLSPGLQERARCAHAVAPLHLAATHRFSLSDLSAVVLFHRDHCGKVSRRVAMMKKIQLWLSAQQHRKRVSRSFSIPPLIIGRVTVLCSHSAYKGIH